MPSSIVRNRERMNQKNKKNTKIHGIGCSSHLDSSGERIHIEGIDISSLTQDGTFNFEHQSKEASAIVGKILEAKKIFKKADCENDHHRYFWDKIKTPYLYISGELLDESGHQAAKDVAAMLRYDRTKNKDTKQLINFSIEGAQLDKRGSDIFKCIARRISITITPCNKVCGAEELINPEDLKKVGSVTSNGETFSAIENLVNKGESSFPSCQIMKTNWGEMGFMNTNIKSEGKTGFVPVTGTTPSEHRPANPTKPKRTFTPQNAPDNMRVGDRIDHTKRPKAKTGAQLYSEKLAAGEKNVTIPSKEMVDEHEKLVDVLESPSHKDDKKEAKKQRKELKGYKEKMNKNNIAEEVQSRIKQKQRPKRMAGKPVRRERPSKQRVGPKQSRLSRLGMYDSNMRKAIAAGGMGGSPSTAVQGEALRKESTSNHIEQLSALPPNKEKQVKKMATAVSNDATVTPSSSFTKSEADNETKTKYKIDHQYYTGTEHTENSKPVSEDHFGEMHLMINTTNNGNIIGSLETALVGNSLEPQYVQVHSQHRRKGVASAMYEHAEKIHGLPLVPSQSQTSAGKLLWSNPKRKFGWGNPKRKFGKSEALRIISNEAFEIFEKKQELIDFLSERLVGLNKKEILALAKTVAYKHQKSREVKLKKMLEKGHEKGVATPHPFRSQHRGTRGTSVAGRDIAQAHSEGKPSLSEKVTHRLRTRTKLEDGGNPSNRQTNKLNAAARAKDKSRARLKDSKDIKPNLPKSEDGKTNMEKNVIDIKTGKKIKPKKQKEPKTPFDSARNTLGQASQLNSKLKDLTADLKTQVKKSKK